MIEVNGKQLTLVTGDKKLSVLLGVKPTLVRSWRLKGVIPSKKTSERGVIYWLEDVIDALQKTK